MSAAASGSSTNPSAQASPLIRPDPSDAKTCTRPSRIRARRYSRRPGFLRLLKSAGTSNPCGTGQSCPASRANAGRAKIRVQTIAATGLPGSPKTGAPCHMPSAKGRPGLTAMRHRSSAPASDKRADTWSSSPADAPPLVRIASTRPRVSSSRLRKAARSSPTCPRSTP